VVQDHDGILFAGVLPCHPFTIWPIVRSGTRLSLAKHGFNVPFGHPSLNTSEVLWVRGGTAKPGTKRNHAEDNRGCQEKQLYDFPHAPLLNVDAYGWSGITCLPADCPSADGQAGAAHEQAENEASQRGKGDPEG